MHRPRPLSSDIWAPAVGAVLTLAYLAWLTHHLAT
jgi:hypothetical protein